AAWNSSRLSDASRSKQGTGPRPLRSFVECFRGSHRIKTRAWHSSGRRRNGIACDKLMRRAMVVSGVAVLLPLVLTLRVENWVHADSASTITFPDVTRASGITFKHDNAASSERYLIETMGAGAAWLDYDNDGYLDLYLVNSAATKAYTPPKPLGGVL